MCKKAPAGEGVGVGGPQLPILYLYSSNKKKIVFLTKKISLINKIKLL